MSLAFPDLDPVAFSWGPFKVKWYGLAYFFGLIFAWCQGKYLIKKNYFSLGPETLDAFIPYATLGIIVGGRLGEVFFYHPQYYFQNPLEIFMLWKPGMSFHGGLVGVMLASWLFIRRYQVTALPFLCLLATLAPMGLAFGRVANFINAELYGRPTTVPWAIIFPYSDGLPRHPSQLYEAFFEGFFLYGVMLFLALKHWAQHRPYLMLSVFCFVYSTSRFILEFFREPEVSVLNPLGFTMGQFLTLPLGVLGLCLWKKHHDHRG